MSHHPALHQRLLDTSHSNTQHKLVMHLENIAPDAIEKVEIPPGVTMIYRHNEAMKVVGREWLE